MTTKKIKLGLKLAKIGFNRSLYHKKRVGAAIITGNRIIIGSNSRKTAPFAKNLGSIWEWVHAEMAVLKNFDATGGHLFIYRHRHDGSWGMARPCNACMALIREKKVKRITYTTPEGVATEKII